MRETRCCFCSREIIHFGRGHGVKKYEKQYAHDGCFNWLKSVRDGIYTHGNMISIPIVVKLIEKLGMNRDTIYEKGRHHQYGI